MKLHGMLITSWYSALSTAGRAIAPPQYVSKNISMPHTDDCTLKRSWLGALQYPSYKGPDVAFHCGLGWENVQKSMYYNLNPHCIEKMRELLEANKAKRLALSEHSHAPTVLPTITVPRPTIPPSSVSSPRSIAYHHHSSSARAISTSAVTHSSSSSIPTPTPIPQAPYSSAVTHSSVAVPGYGIMDAAPTPSPAPPPKREPATTPMEVDLTVSDPDSNATGGRAKRKNAGKRRIDSEEMGQHVRTHPNPFYHEVILIKHSSFPM